MYLDDSKNDIGSMDCQPSCENGVRKKRRNLKEFLHVTSAVVENWNDCITISVVYSLFKHIENEQYINFSKILGNRFIAAGIYNTKRIMGINIDLTKRREFLKAIKAMNLATVSTGKLAYWPSDKKIPNLLDFGIIKGIPKDFYCTESCLELSSDHSPIIITVNNKIMTILHSLQRQNKLALLSKITNDYF